VEVVAHTRADPQQAAHPRAAVRKVKEEVREIREVQGDQEAREEVQGEVREVRAQEGRRISSDSSPGCHRQLSLI
jgi:hypothetical protein